MSRSDKAQDGWCVLQSGRFVLLTLLSSLLLRPALPAEHIVAADNLWQCSWPCMQSPEQHPVECRGRLNLKAGRGDEPASCNLEDWSKFVAGEK
jgi:hypothetical protein